MPHKVAKNTMAPTSNKRPYNSTNAPSKKRKLASGKVASATNASGNKGKQHAFERPIVPIPNISSSDEGDLSDQDIQFFEKNQAGAFLNELNQNDIARSKKEINRLHALFKLTRSAKTVDDLPSLDSHDEDEEEWSDSQNYASLELSNHECERDSFDGFSSLDSEVERSYERKPRKQREPWDSSGVGTISRLPIKLPDGRVVRMGQRTAAQPEHNSENETEPVPAYEQSPVPVVEDVTTGARFGRLAVANVIGTRSRKARIQLAKEQIASICQDILSEPEASLGLLRRLHTFSLPQIKIPQSPTPIPNDSLIRRLAMISQLAVFKDVIPGYRIRPLTDAEKSEKVSQMVARTREWEQGLVGVYQIYLKALESEIKAQSEFSDLALKSMCTLLSDATHFNFRTNIMSAIVARLSKKSWDQSSDLCLQTLITVFRKDLTGVPSLEIVRILNRMIKERNFAVHPNAISCLLHLRLKSELGGIRASDTKADKESSAVAQWDSKGKADRKRAKGKKVDRPYMSKRVAKAFKERKEIEEQMREAEAEVDREERANVQTETLKLLFVLYFRILKTPQWTLLLPPALQGLSRYAHLVNIDFFKDLMQVLKDHITRDLDNEKPLGPADAELSFKPLSDQVIQHRLLCISTAFELLSGQGDALNIDLEGFVNQLYKIIPLIALQPDIESILPSGTRMRSSTVLQQTTSDLLFHALSLAFSARTAGSGSSVRCAAFAKRLLIASLSFPAATVLRSLDFVYSLFVKESKLQVLLSPEDRTFDGLYRPELDDPQLSNPFGTSLWEIAHLAETHCDSRVREKARELARFTGT